MKLESEQFQNEIDYGIAIHLAKEMLAAGIINKQEFTRIDKMYAQQYHPVFENQAISDPPAERQD